ncbi:hypothetical protein QFZ80_004782 [Paenibacillus sp. V4I7]|nr:hypothetical protein [Paenibacillus sp. V4I7]MDQ0900954.1 hypothetical protein [Paenibacillus sp. V4I7]MDQ0920546.1 hypothetical protein [Paenibacillus sp. V4I5]
MLRIVAHESVDPAYLEGLNRALSYGSMILCIAESDLGYRLESTPLREG